MTRGRHRRSQAARLPFHCQLGTLALRAWPALPALCLLRPAVSGSRLLGDYAGAVLGLDATLALVACLTITPLLTAVRLRIAELRWWYGIWVFTLGAAGLAITVAAGGPGGLAARAAGSAVNWTGLAIVITLLPLTATSNKAAQKLLGPEWKRWQRQLTWAVYVLVLGHLLLLHALLTAAALAGATAPLIALRWPRLRKAVKKWRAGGYASGGLWALLTAGGVLMAVSLVIVLIREGQAIACAITLT